MAIAFQASGEHVAECAESVAGSWDASEVARVIRVVHVHPEGFYGDVEDRVGVGWVLPRRLANARKELLDRRDGRRRMVPQAGEVLHERVNDAVAKAAQLLRRQRQRLKIVHLAATGRHRHRFRQDSRVLATSSRLVTDEIIVMSWNGVTSTPRLSECKWKKVRHACADDVGRSLRRTTPRGTQPSILVCATAARRNEQRQLVRGKNRLVRDSVTAVRREPLPAG